MFIRVMISLLLLLVVSTLKVGMCDISIMFVFSRYYHKYYLMSINNVLDNTYNLVDCFYARDCPMEKISRP